MKLTLQREHLLKPLLWVTNIIDKRPLQPILANVLLQVKETQLCVTGSDSDIEIVALMPLDEVNQTGEVSVSARKLLDICRSLPENMQLTLSASKDRLLVKSGRSRFSLASLPAHDYPKVEDVLGDCEIVVKSALLRQIIERTAFAMAQQDVRYYLNGLLLELKDQRLYAVATDAHRLAVASLALEGQDNAQTLSVIVPRKGITELLRLLATCEDTVTLVVNKQHLSVHAQSFMFTSKLVEGRFPDYERVMHQKGERVVCGASPMLKQAIMRAAILSNEKNRGVRLSLDQNILRISGNNQEQEEAVEALEIEYHGDSFDIGFNASYLTDVLAVLGEGQMRMTLSDHQSFALITQDDDVTQSRYVVMPLQL